MKTTSDILDKLYKTINVTSVKNTIDGKIYRRKKPLGSQIRDIEILCQPIDNEENAVTQSCVAIINCFAPNFNNGLPDETNLKTMAAAVISVIGGYAATTSYFQPQVTSETVMSDYDDPKMSYSSIRINCSIEA